MTDETSHVRGLLLGGRFADLEDALCERVARRCREQPLRPLTIVVGSSAVRRRVNDVLVRGLKALAGVRVVTLAAFAADVVAASTVEPPALLTGLARERLVRRLLDDHADELTYFRPVLDRPNFARALDATFTDLRQACVAPLSGWDVAGTRGGPEDDRQRDRSADLSLLYRAYCEELSRLQLSDGAGLFLEAARAIAAGTARPGATVVYGVYDVNQAQQTFIAGLAERGADVLVPAPVHRDVAGTPVWTAVADAGTPHDAGQAGGSAPGREPIGSGGSSSDRDLDRVAVVWEGAESVRGLRPVGFAGDGTLSVLSVADERAEAREAVRAVIAAVRGAASTEETATLRECAVVVPRGDDVERLAAAFEAAGLPVACRRPDRSPGSRLVRRLADCLSPAAGPPFGRRAVVDLLTVAPLHPEQPSPAATALWLDEARRAGVVAGIDDWVARISRRRRGLDRQVAELASLPDAETADTDDDALEARASVADRHEAVAALEAAAGRLASACRRLPAGAATWNDWADGFAVVVEALFEPAAAASAVDAADRLRGLAVVGERVTAVEAANVLRTLAESATVPVGRVGGDGVAVLTPLEMRGLRFHTVVFTGLAEGVYPVPGRPDPILGDAERRRVAEALGVRLPLAEERADEAELLFAFACEAAGRRLVLSAPRADAASGRPCQPSRLLLRLASAGAGRPVGADAFLAGTGLEGVWRRVAGPPRYDGPGGDWIDAREHDTQALLWLTERGGDAAARACLATILDAPHAARRLDAWAASRSRTPGAYDGLLGAQAREALRGLPDARRPFAGELSATRLERFITCPFAFFLRDLLGLVPPDEPGASLEIEPSEFGKLAHAILQRTYRQVIDEALTRRDALAALDDACEVCFAEVEQRGVTGAALPWAVRRAMLAEDLRETVRRDPVFDGGVRPLEVEWTFGAADGRPVGLALDDGRQVGFRGRIDRFDGRAGGVLVIDYKTGSCNAERERVGHQLSVQLPVYRLAVRQAAGVSGEIACEYRPVTRRGAFEAVPLPGDEASGERRLAELVAGALDLVHDGMFPRTTAGRCDWCDVGYACGLSAWQRDRRRDHETLAGVVALQTRPPQGTDSGV